MEIHLTFWCYMTNDGYLLSICYTLCMDIEEFVSKTLDQIMNGIQERKMENSQDLIYLNGDIDFDLAVTVAQGTNRKEDVGGKGDIKIISVGGSATTEEFNQNTVVSRVKFCVRQAPDPIKVRAHNSTLASL